MSKKTATTVIKTTPASAAVEVETVTNTTVQETTMPHSNPNAVEIVNTAVQEIAQEITAPTSTIESVQNAVENGPILPATVEPLAVEQSDAPPADAEIAELLSYTLSALGSFKSLSLRRNVQYWRTAQGLVAIKVRIDTFNKTIKVRANKMEWLEWIKTNVPLSQKTVDKMLKVGARFKSSDLFEGLSIGEMEAYANGASGVTTPEKIASFVAKFRADKEADKEVKKSIGSDKKTSPAPTPKGQPEEKGTTSPAPTADPEPTPTPAADPVIEDNTDGVVSADLLNLVTDAEKFSKNYRTVKKIKKAEVESLRATIALLAEAVAYLETLEAVEV